MKKFFSKVALAAIMITAVPSVSRAQISLQNALKSAASTVASTVSNSSNSTAATVASLVSTVIGTSTVSSSSIEGTWIYSKPCLAFESENILATLSSSAIAKKGQTYLQKGLVKAGFTEGKVSITFNSDGTTVITVGSKKVSGTYTLEGSDLKLTYTGVLTGVSKSVTTNVKLDGSDLQIAMSAKKLLTLVQTVSSTASSANTTLSTVSSLFSSVNGMYVGLQFEKE